MKISLIIVLVVMACSGFLLWSEKHTKELVQSSMKYEECVQTFYGMTPIQWYADNGKYPECNN